MSAGPRPGRLAIAALRAVRRAALVAGLLTAPGCCFGGGEASAPVEPVPSAPGRGGLRLRVVDEAGAPVVGGRLDVHGVVADEDVYLSFDLDGELGDRAIPDIVPGRYILSLRARDGRGGALPEDVGVWIEEGDTSVASFAVHGGHDVEGRVVDSISGAPLRGLVVRAGARRGVLYTEQPLTFVRTGEDGCFVLAGVCEELSVSRTATADTRALPGYVARRVSLPAARCDVVTRTAIGDIRLERAAAELVSIDESYSVTRIEEGSPAQGMGLRVGDRIVAVEGGPYHAPGGGPVETSLRSPAEALVVFDLRDEPILVRVVGADGATRELRATLRVPS